MYNITRELFSILNKMFDLPKNVTEVNLNINVDSLPTLTVSYYPDLNTDIETKVFELKEVE